MESRRATVKLIELVRNEPEMWDVGDTNYHKKDKRSLATDRVAFAMEASGKDKWHELLKFVGFYFNLNILHSSN